METIIEQEVCQNTRDALTREWLDTNGTGSYASSTILNSHTRKYHGLLVANLKQPAGRFVLLSKFEDSIAANGKEFFLSCHKYPGVFIPHGHHYLSEFRQGLHPEFTYTIGDVVLEKSLMMISGTDRVLIRYHLKRASMPLQLRLKPLLAYRNFHDLAKENFHIQVRTFSWEIRNGFKITPYNGMPDLFLQTSCESDFLPSPVWYRNFEYAIETQRGFPDKEDLFQPGIFEINMDPGETVYISAALAECRDTYAKTWASELKRRAAFAKPATRRPATDNGLGEARDLMRQSARNFLVTTPDDRASIIAGYPWFGDWGRDTLIALPGLTFCLGKPETGLAILKSFAAAERNGLIPNFFNANGEHAYNSVDAALWFFWAVQQMVATTGDYAAVKKHLWPAMQNIIRHYQQGTDYEIGMEPDGLISAGNALTQLTWMDAMSRGAPVTPRHGLAVEINALWYNALNFANELAIRFKTPDMRCETLIEQVRQSFVEKFWIEDEEYLGDVITNGILDRSVRPNQIFAVSLPYSPLADDQALAVVNRVQRALLTPYGLRTLAPDHPSYRGHYAGDGDERDAAYHQGTVWPWLIGPFGEALLKTATNKVAAAAFLRKHLTPLLVEHLPAYGINHIAEVFDGDPPHFPNGCIAQAWSLAEVIRLLTLIDQAAVPPRVQRNKKAKVKRRRVS